MTTRSLTPSRMGMLASLLAYAVSAACCAPTGRGRAAGSRPAIRTTTRSMNSSGVRWDTPHFGASRPDSHPNGARQALWSALILSPNRFPRNMLEQQASRVRSVQIQAPEPPTVGAPRRGDRQHGYAQSPRDGACQLLRRAAATDRAPPGPRARGGAAVARGIT